MNMGGRVEKTNLTMSYNLCLDIVTPKRNSLGVLSFFYINL